MFFYSFKDLHPMVLKLRSPGSDGQNRSICRFRYRHPTQPISSYAMLSLDTSSSLLFVVLQILDASCRSVNQLLDGGLPDADNSCIMSQPRHVQRQLSHVNSTIVGSSADGGLYGCKRYCG